MLTAIKLRERTGNDELYDQAVRAEGALRLFGITPNASPTDYYFLLDCSRSTAGERGRDPRTGAPIPGQTDLMKGVVDKAMVLGALLDPNDQCGAISFGTEATALPSLTPDNYHTWYETHMPRVGGRTNLGAAMRLTLESISEEQNVPALRSLATLRRDTPDDALPRIHLPNPVSVIAVIEGDPSDGALVERILHATKFVAIRWTFVFVSNERLGLQMLRSMQQISLNVQICEFPEGMQQVETPLFYAEILNGQQEWYAEWQSVPVETSAS